MALQALAGRALARSPPHGCPGSPGWCLALWEDPEAQLSSRLRSRSWTPAPRAADSSLATAGPLQAPRVPGPSTLPEGASKSLGAGWEGKSPLAPQTIICPEGNTGLFQGRAQKGRTLPSKALASHPCLSEQGLWAPSAPRCALPPAARSPTQQRSPRCAPVAALRAVFTLNPEGKAASANGTERELPVALKAPIRGMAVCLPQTEEQMPQGLGTSFNKQLPRS